MPDKYRILEVSDIPTLETAKDKTSQVLVAYYNETNLIESAIFSKTEWDSKDKQKLIADYRTKH